MNTYARLGVEFTHGDGVWLYDTNGQRYLDGLSGIAVCGLGYANPELTAAIADQAGKLMHTSNLFEIGLQSELADKLCQVSGMERVFFANSGAEANEAAIKIARLYGHKKGLHSPSIIVAESAFHGRTMATLSASGNRKIQAGFEPLVSGFIRAPYGDTEALENIGRNNQQVVAVMLEPMQGEAGVQVPHEENYLAHVRELCDKNGWLLILDEVQTGNGRTGSWFAYQQMGFMPDVVTTAKGLGNGVPIGACMAQGVAATTFEPGNHGSTFGGNLLACRAALTVLEQIEARGLCEQATARGEQLASEISDKLAGLGIVKEVRGKGLMLAIELTIDCAGLVQKGLDNGVIFNVAGGNNIRLLPPLTISKEETTELANKVCETVNAHYEDLNSKVQAAS